MNNNFNENSCYESKCFNSVKKRNDKNSAFKLNTLCKNLIKKLKNSKKKPEQNVCFIEKSTQVKQIFNKKQFSKVFKQYILNLLKTNPKADYNLGELMDYFK